MTPDKVCCLTPAGAAALAVVAMRGPTVWHKLAPFFESRSKPPQLSPQPCVSFGILKEGGLGDEVVLILQGDEQFQVVEVQLHGGPGVVAWFLQLAIRLGCTMVEWPDWLDDEIARLLPAASTRQTASILLDQAQGAFHRALADIQARSQPFVDHPTLVQELDRLLAWHSLGAHLVKPWKVLLLGSPNAGKSSLLNAIVGFERAIIAATPGTTRDIVSATIAWDGYPLEFLDTAGMRETSDALEAAGITHARLGYDQADLVLWLMDRSQPASFPPIDIKPDYLIGTKADLPSHCDALVDFTVSAHTGEGIQPLLAAILKHLLPVKPTPGQAIPVTPSQVAQLQRLRNQLSDSSTLLGEAGRS